MKTGKIKFRLEFLKEKAFELLYPRVCPVCGRILAHEESGENPYICKRCYPLLRIPEGARCLKCSRPLEEETAALCPDCSGRERWFDQGISLLTHDSIAKKILYDLKYSNKRDNADVLAYEAAARYGPLLRHWKPEAMIPIPLYARKEQQRGFNQAAQLSGRLSYHLKEKGIMVPVDAGLLVRVKKTTVQKELDKYQRAANIKGAFAIAEETSREPDGRSRNFPYRSVLLVDDIFTSGATLSEAARVLKEAGAQKVYFFTGSIG